MQYNRSLSHTQGNLQFQETEQEELQIANPDTIAVIASMLACTSEAVEKALCFRVVGNKLGAVEKMHTVEQAEYGRDAFAKVRCVCVCVCVCVCDSSQLIIPLGNLRETLHLDCSTNQHSTRRKRCKVT